MRVSDKALVLQCVKRSDHKYILNLFTQQHGQITVSAVVSKSPGSRVKPGHILPLSLLQAQLLLKQSRDIQTLTEASCYSPLLGISGSIQKLGIAQFFNEVLLKCLKGQQTNEHLFQFVETCLCYLNDSETNYLNLPVYFLCELSRYLGFEPQNNFSEITPYFDCREGRFSELSFPSPLGFTAEESVLFSSFLAQGGLDMLLNNGQRKRLTGLFLNYYRLHVPAFNEIKSYVVLQEIMATR